MAHQKDSELRGSNRLAAGPRRASRRSCALSATVPRPACRSGFIQGLRDGILVLLFPPLVIGLSLAIMAYRKRNTFSGSDSRFYREV